MPKRYVPPFLKEEPKTSLNEEEFDNIYALEIEGFRDTKDERDHAAIGDAKLEVTA